MTDLEELWEDYPTGKPPVAALLRTARADARARRRRYLVRPLLIGATTAAVAAAFVLGGHVRDAGMGGGASTAAGGSGAGESGALVAPKLRHSAFQASLTPAESCRQLLRSYQDRALKQVTAYGWSYGGYAMLQDGVRQLNGSLGYPAVNAAGPASPTDSVAAPSVANEASGTNVQEAGVDEPDRVKTNGTLLVRAGHDAIRVYDVSGETVRRTAQLTLPDLRDPELVLDGTTLVALGTDTAKTPLRSADGTRVTTVSLADPAHPRITHQVRYSGARDTARLQGSAVHLVLADGLPDLPFARASFRAVKRGGITESSALAHNREVVRRSTLDDWLPRVDDGSGSRPLLACDQVALPPDGVALGTESIVGFDLATPDAPTAIGIAGTTNVTYESADHLYLTTAGFGGCIECVRPMASDSVGGLVPRPPTDGTSHIFQFDLHGVRATHVATGTIHGSIADRWSMDEADGVLRVAITRLATEIKPSSASAASSASLASKTSTVRQASSIVTMRAEGDTLAEIGRLDGLGIGETLTAARWFDGLAVLSTARQTDPLYTVDLTDPTRPRLLGALHIPGFTDYFHPIGDDLLIGIGQSVSFTRSREHQRAQVGLFDISDLAHVQQVDVARLQQWTSPYAAFDARAFTWLPDRHTAISSFRTRNGSTMLGVYTVHGPQQDGQQHLGLTQHLTPLDGHRWTMTVRTMELPNGKVVLMAGGRVSFLDL